MLRLTLFIFVIMTLPAAAHPGQDHADALAGFLHPLTGVDHVAAMLAVGAWSALIGGSRLWAWPLAFIGAMIAGGILGHIGFTMPLVEQSIAASLVVIGLLLALAVNASATGGVFVVATFALFHGFAHGCEAGNAAWLPFTSGFVVATALLHLAGIGAARGLMLMFNALPVRVIGAVTAVAGITLLMK